MIRFENVAKIFPGNVMVLDNINIVFRPGEFVSLVGASGAGKSTLLKLIYAEEVPTQGEVYFNERPVGKINRKHLPFFRRDIGTVFQDYKLLPQRTVFENVAYALEVDGRSTTEINEEVPEILEIVGLGDKTHKFPKQLSGGEQQRVSLARALIHRPKVIIADEPTGNLDPVSADEIIQLLLEINSFGTTVLLATHNKGIVDKIGRRVVLISKGQIIHDQNKGKYILS
ncbi:MAG: cell division ATP-binding protein FtsE [Candidatus Moranbacteria bacterium CG_4_10_14_3_um_filter_45_9]|nr:MAG: cell division ATP-binding protein FtsE [Candidatus Moranbacteria bacterium CG2_30_45_14]PIX90410.1 MAG: cell division ATP-binding protein FtsE [Candidatus Moranbacteria bacterium CG_4_10_14_3_um_filter_45_9]